MSDIKKDMKKIIERMEKEHKEVMRIKTSKMDKDERKNHNQRLFRLNKLQIALSYYRDILE